MERKTSIPADCLLALEPAIHTLHQGKNTGEGPPPPATNQWLGLVLFGKEIDPHDGPPA
jgi:hypothetical protein